MHVPERFEDLERDDGDLGGTIGLQHVSLELLSSAMKDVKERNHSRFVNSTKESLVQTSKLSDRDTSLER